MFISPILALAVSENAIFFERDEWMMEMDSETET